MAGLSPHSPMTSKEQQRKANVRLALILVSVALLFLMGFVAKIAILGPK
jgi:hypothetical protein